MAIGLGDAKVLGNMGDCCLDNTVYICKGERFVGNASKTSALACGEHGR
jgi:hypothetical protein